MIQIHGLSKAYGKKRAVIDLDLAVGPGEIVGFIGPNGAGKSTTLKILTGLLPADSGRVAVCGFDIGTDSIAARQRLGYVPESPQLYESLSADAFLDVIGALHHIDRATSTRRREELLDLFGLSDVRYKWLREFSKGMKQKVVIAAALIHQPDVLILDEPFDGVDANMVLVLKAVLGELAAQGRGVLVSSHIMDVVERLCSRIAIIHEGRLIAEGTPAEIQAAAGVSTLEAAFASLTATRDTTATTAAILSALNRS
jgi:ABC-2 type transport system ATP-binding protein